MPHPPIIVPKVGKGKEHEADSTMAACREAAREAALLDCDTLLLFTPHAPLHRDSVYVYGGESVEGSLAAFGAEDARFSFGVDTVFRDKLVSLWAAEGIESGPNPRQGLDHGALVPLYFFGEAFAAPPRVVVAASAPIGSEKQYRLGTLVRKAAEETGRRVCIVASGDMSHRVNRHSPYGTVPEGALFDRMVSDALASSDPAALLGIDAGLRETAAECGYGSLVILCGAFDGIPLETRLVGYEAPFGIGYCVASFTPKDPVDLRVRIAKHTIDAFVREGKTASRTDLESLCDGAGDRVLLAELSRQRAGVFVSLKMRGELRGCIGTTAPTTASLADEIIQNAVSAATMDPRFDPVGPAELPLLSISVDVLGASEPVGSRSELDPSLWGVIVSKNGRRGLLLPDLEGVETVEEQLAIACRKGGIDSRCPYDIERFSVTRYR